MTFQLWHLVAVKDESRSTWELVGSFPSVKAARLRISELAGRNIVSPDENTFWFEDHAGVQTYRIEAVLPQR